MNDLRLAAKHMPQGCEIRIRVEAGLFAAYLFTSPCDGTPAGTGFAATLDKAVDDALMDAR